MITLLIGLGMVIMMCLTCISCKKEAEIMKGKDKTAHYPTELKGIWTGYNELPEHSRALFMQTATEEACIIALVYTNKNPKGYFEEAPQQTPASQHAHTSQHAPTPQHGEDGKLPTATTILKQILHSPA